MKIKEMLVNPNRYNIKCPYTMVPKGICVHNTANSASAESEILYMIGNSNETGFHIAVDDKEAVMGIPLNRNAWHCGDGNGFGNRSTIAIEICYSKAGGEKFDKAEENCAELITDLMSEFHLTVFDIYTHQHFATNKKYCPHRTLDKGWDRFIDMVKAKITDNPRYSIYTIVSGDTLWSISKRFGVTVDDILVANKIENPDLISIGTQVLIPFK